MAAPSPLRIEAPRQLRLSALLAELRADAERRKSAIPGAVGSLREGALIAAPGRPVVVDASDGLTIAEMLDATAHAGFGFVAAFLALIAIPFVGLSTPFGLAVAFVGVQILVGKQRPWLPERIRRKQVSVHALDTMTRWLTRMTRWMTYLVRARWPRMTSAAGFKAVGIGLVIQGLGLALPIPVPGSNLIFLVPILIYAIGVLDDDGLLVALGHVATLINVGCIVALWAGVEVAVRHGLHWLSGVF
jgi:hypothetical protein